MIKIPLIEPVSNNFNIEYIDNFNLNIDEILEKFSEKQQTYILDIFENILGQEDEELKNLENDYFKLINEKKYLNFLKETFELNNKICYVRVKLSFEKYENVLYYIDNLDKIDKYIILENLKKIDTTKTELYKINHLNILNFFAKGILREVFDCILLFPKDKVFIFSNYDMSLPIIFKNKKNINKYKELAKKNFLFIRK